MKRTQSLDNTFIGGPKRFERNIRAENYFEKFWGARKKRNCKQPDDNSVISFGCSRNSTSSNVARALKMRIQISKQARFDANTAFLPT